MTAEHVDDDIAEMSHYLQRGPPETFLFGMFIHLGAPILLPFMVAVHLPEGYRILAFVPLAALFVLDKYRPGLWMTWAFFLGSIVARIYARGRDDTERGEQ